MDDREIVSALRAALADKVGQERFDLWFGPTTRLSLRGQGLTIEVPNRFTQDWLRTHFRREIEESCLLAVGGPVHLEFRIDAGLAQHKAPRPAQPAGEPAAAVSELVARRMAGFDSFIAGPANQLALSAAQIAARQPGQYSPLVLHGPTGVGKTHLLEAICGAAKAARRQAHAVYLTAEQFTTLFLEALRGSGLPSFRRKYRAVELLIIDDLQFFAGKKATLNELLFTIDTLLKERRQLVFSCDRPPAEIDELGPEMQTRLAGGMLCRLEPPDLQTRLGIVRQRAGKLGLSLSDDVALYVATHLTSHARELAGALNLLHLTSQAHTTPVTRAMAEEALADMVRHSGRVVKLADIDLAVCKFFGLQPDSLQSDRKAKLTNHPRMLAMWLARKHTRSAYSEIGAYFGQRSHSTVISAHKKVSGWMTGEGPVDLAGRPLNVEDAIRRVEETLRVG